MEFSSSFFANQKAMMKESPENGGLWVEKQGVLGGHWPAYLSLFLSPPLVVLHPILAATLNPSLAHKWPMQ